MTAQHAAGNSVDSAHPEVRREKPPAGFDAVFAPYFDGLREGRLRVQWCTECSRYQWPARSVCLECHAKGTPFASVTPYAVALVELADENVRMFAHVPEPYELSIGSRVAVDFENVTVVGYPTWRLIDDSERG